MRGAGAGGPAGARSGLVANGGGAGSLDSTEVPGDPGTASIEESAVAVRAIRGATQVAADDRDEVLGATRELVSAVLERNEVDPADLISILFTATPDLVWSSRRWPHGSSGWATYR